MNWLLIVCIVFAVFEVIQGYRSGFAKKLVSICSALIAVLAVILLAPLVRDLVLQNTTWQTQLAGKIGAAITEKAGSEQGLPAFLSGLKLPNGLKELLGLTGEGLSGTFPQQVESISMKLAQMVITVGAYAATFIVVLILLRVLTGIAGLVRKIPAIGKADGLLGAVLGLAECVIVVDTVCLIIMTISNTPFGQTLTGLISDSPVLTFIYEHNLLMMFWQSMFSAKT